MVLTNRSLSMPTSSGAHSGVIVISDTVWWCLVFDVVAGVAVVRRVEHRRQSNALRSAANCKGQVPLEARAASLR